MGNIRVEKMKKLEALLGQMPSYMIKRIMKDWTAGRKEAHLRDYPTWGKYDQKAYDILSEMISSI